MKPFVSLCVLSYKRPSMLRNCLTSLVSTADYPYELIVNCDGGDDPENTNWLLRAQQEGKISKLTVTGGLNRGVGRSLQQCLSIAEGQYFAKIDTDLEFKPGWLSKAVAILNDDATIGTVSLFDYRHYDPNDTRFQIIESHPNHNIVTDFVSSIFVARMDYFKKVWNPYDPIPDDGLHQMLGGKLAITKEDYVTNDGFGVTKSTYVSGTEDHPYKTPTHTDPLIFRL